MIRRWIHVAALCGLASACVNSEHSGFDEAPPPSMVSERMATAFHRVCFEEQRCLGGNEQKAHEYCALFSLSQHDSSKEMNDCNYATLKLFDCLGDEMASECSIRDGACDEEVRTGLESCGSTDALMPRLQIEYPPDLAELTHRACIVSAMCGQTLSFSCNDLGVATYWIYNQSLRCINALTSFVSCISELSSCDDSPCFLLEGAMHEACRE